MRRRGGRGSQSRTWVYPSCARVSRAWPSGGGMREAARVLGGREACVGNTSGDSDDAAAAEVVLVLVLVRLPTRLRGGLADDASGIRVVGGRRRRRWERVTRFGFTWPRHWSPRLRSAGHASVTHIRRDAERYGRPAAYQRTASDSRGCVAFTCTVRRRSRAPTAAYARRTSRRQPDGCGGGEQPWCRWKSIRTFLKTAGDTAICALAHRHNAAMGCSGTQLGGSAHRCTIACADRRGCSLSVRRTHSAASHRGEFSSTAARLQSVATSWSWQIGRAHV